MKRKIRVVFLLASFLIVPLAGAGQEEKKKPEEPAPRHRVVNLSLFYPVSLNRSKKDTSNVSLSLLYGRQGAVRGLDLSLGAAVVEGSLEGAQLAGLVAVAGETMSGVQAAGLFSVAGDGGEGVQVAGLGSIAGEEFSGLQAAGLFAIAGESLTGAQLSALFNVAGEAAEGWQSSCLFNVAGDDLDGIQMAGLFNVAGENSRALQMACLMNVTGETCRGLQVGLINIAGRLTGAQVGLVNVAGEIEGAPVGLVNLTRKEDRRIRMAVWAGSVSLVNAGVKIRAKNFYSILYAGTVNLTQDEHEGLAYGFHYGYGFPVGASRQGRAGKRIDVDAGYVYLDNSTVFRAREGTPDRHVLSVRGALAIELSPEVSLVAGGGLGYRIDNGAGFSSGSFFPLVFAGLELF